MNTKTTLPYELYPATTEKANNSYDVRIDGDASLPTLGEVSTDYYGFWEAYAVFPGGDGFLGSYPTKEGAARKIYEAWQSVQAKKEKYPQPTQPTSRP